MSEDDTTKLILDLLDKIQSFLKSDTNQNARVLFNYGEDASGPEGKQKKTMKSIKNHICSRMSKQAMVLMMERSKWKAKKDQMRRWKR